MEWMQANIIDMNDPSIPDEVKDNIEFTIDINDSESDSLNIHLKRNNTLAHERKVLREKILKQDKLTNNTERLDYNVLVFYIDNFSRANFRRKLPKLHAFFNKYGDGTDNDHLATMYFRYHGTATNTAKNNNALFLGIEEYTANTTENNVFRYFRDNGYVLGKIGDECTYDADRYEAGLRPEEPIYDSDHYGGSLS